MSVDGGALELEGGLACSICVTGNLCFFHQPACPAELDANGKRPAAKTWDTLKVRPWNLDVVGLIPR